MKLSILLLLLGALSTFLILKVLLKTLFVHIFLDLPDPRKVHQRLVPRMGGFGILISFLFLSAIFIQEQGMGPALVIQVGALAMLFLGLLDDSSLVYYLRRARDRRKGITFTDPKGWFLRVRWKFLLEFSLAAFAVWALDLRFPLPTLFGLELGSSPLAYVMAWVWVVGVSNAFNIIDGIDGLCGGVALLTMLAMLSITLLLGISFVALPVALVAGALVGFLILNTHPAKLFMGDMGSLFVGFAVAVISLYLAGKLPRTDVLFPMYLAGLPVLDVFAAMIRRFFLSVPPRSTLKVRLKRMVAADSSHVHHRLLAQGFSHLQASFTLYLMASVFLTGAVLVSVIATELVIWVHVYLFFAAAIAVGVFFYQERLRIVAQSLDMILYPRKHRRFQIGVVTPSPLLRSALEASALHPFDFNFLDTEDSLTQSRGFLQAMLVEQFEEESTQEFITRLAALFADREEPALVLCSEPIEVQATTGFILPQLSVALYRRPLYVHPVFFRLGHLVGASADTIHPPLVQAAQAEKGALA